MARKEVYAVELGRGLQVRLVQNDDGERNPGVFDYYSVDLDGDGCGCIVQLSTKCIGRKSGEYWCDNAVKIMKKIIFIADSIDMAMHNLMCYSSNLLMNAPKEGYAYEWHQENDKVKMLRAWMYELTGYWGEDSSKTKEIREIFVEYIG